MCLTQFKTIGHRLQILYPSVKTLHPAPLVSQAGYGPALKILWCLQSANILHPDPFMHNRFFTYYIHSIVSQGFNFIFCRFVQRMPATDSPPVQHSLRKQPRCALRQQVEIGAAPQITCNTPKRSTKPGINQGCQFGFFLGQLLKFCFYSKKASSPKTQTRSGFLAFFSWKGLTLEKRRLGCIGLFITIFWREYDLAKCKKHCKDFNVALKFSMYLIRNKSASVQSREKKMLLKIGIVLPRCFWRVLISILCLVVHVLCKCFVTAIWRFQTRSTFFGEDSWQPCYKRNWTELQPMHKGSWQIRACFFLAITKSFCCCRTVQQTNVSHCRVFFS